MELEKLREFIEFMKENNLCELEIEEEGRHIKLKKAEISPAAAFIPGAAAALEPPQLTVEKNTALIEIKSPMVGTFYRAPASGAKPYAEVGAVIKAGEVVCIVEAMKLMNEIKADAGGRIVKVCVENGASVEFGQVLFCIEPA